MFLTRYKARGASAFGKEASAFRLNARRIPNNSISEVDDNLTKTSD
jgi:hypothetical protein